MKILLLHFLSMQNQKHAAVLKKLQQTVNAAGHEAVLCSEKDSVNLHMGMYEYIAVIVPASPLFGAKLPEKLPEILSTHGSVSGKKGCVLVVKSGFSSGKMCRITMRALEKEGMVVDYFDIIESADHAAYTGKKIG
ncbi:hypothetical protein H0R92_10995 [Treponema sp. OMZ 840]|uniref:hypothetical protein n=1 Tax=Treponema sp. OMZ 840 TaxID=244313 RepID=UPI003D9412C6